MAALELTKVTPAEFAGYLGNTNFRWMKLRVAAEWFENLPEHWKARAYEIREMILQASPIMREKLRYNLPFYDHHSWLFYFIIPSGGEHKGRLILAFLNGKHLADPEGLLAMTDHKLISRFVVPKASEPFPFGAFSVLVSEALLLNEEAKKDKQRK